MERVQVINGKEPIIFVCPHGIDDSKTGHIAKTAAKSGNCYAVINWGFKRGPEVNVLKDIADCNRIDHVLQDVVKEEFLDSILNIKRKILVKNGINSPVYIFYIHGFGKQVEKDEEIDVILGYGENSGKSKITCENKIIDALLFDFDAIGIKKVYCGISNGKYSAASKNNMCQYFRMSNVWDNISCVQMEISSRFRSRKDDACFFGFNLGLIAKNIMSPRGHLTSPRKYI